MESHKLTFTSSRIKFMKNATTSKIQLLEQNKEWSVKQKHNFLLRQQQVNTKSFFGN